MSIRSSSRTVAVVGLLSLASGAMAQFNHGDIMANNYWFRQVTESSNTDAQDTAFANAGNMFGAPSTTNDSILFSCPNFFADAIATNGGVDFDNTDGRLRFVIEAKQGAVVSSFSFAERGDWQFSGINFTGQVTVACDVQVRVLEVNGVGVAPIGGVFSLSFTNAGHWNAPPLSNGAWTGSGGINIDALVLGAGITTGYATKVEVTLDNKLSATTLAGNPGAGTSRIVKKQGEGVVINVIPAPGAAALLGLAGLVVGRRRR